MKLTKCPTCGNKSLSDQWQRNRKLQQACSECGWLGKIRTPEILEVRTSKDVCVNQFNGFCYQVFDKYGHIMTFSRTYYAEEEAEKELLKELKQGKSDKDAGPYTGILWPDVVCVEGKVYGK